MSFTVASLFAGIGGIEKGFEQAGAEIIWANEYDKKACITYRANFKHTLIEEDIRNLHASSMPDVDIITAGWPCVAFSIAGNRHGMKYRCDLCGVEHGVTYEEYLIGAKCPVCIGKTEPMDPRGTLFFDVIRFIREKKPKAILLENVKNLKGHDNGNTFRVIMQMLRESGYFVDSKILNTMEYGNIPQNRERIFIVGFREEDALNYFAWPQKIPLTKTIDDILDRNEQQNSIYYYTSSSKYYEMIKKSLSRKNTVYQLRRVYIRENKNNVCPTLTANMGTGGNNVPLIIDHWGYRKLTPKETLRFQGFPVDFDYVIPKNIANSHLYKQAGNAVSVPVVRRIAESMMISLELVLNRDRRISNKKPIVKKVKVTVPSLRSII